MGQAESMGQEGWLLEFDSQMEEIKSAAEKEGKVVRFVRSIYIGRKQVKFNLKTYSKSFSNYRKAK